MTMLTFTPIFKVSQDSDVTRILIGGGGANKKEI